MFVTVLCCLMTIVVSCSFLDDLDVSPDFFEYFKAMFPILHSDPTLWCVSAWNDNGKTNMVSDDPGNQVCLFIVGA